MNKSSFFLAYFHNNISVAFCLLLRQGIFVAIECLADVDLKRRH